MSKDRTGEVTLLDLPCPRCGNRTVLCVLLVTEAGRHNHTKYMCVLYGSGRRSACGWTGWTVPEPFDSVPVVEDTAVTTRKEQR